MTGTETPQTAPEQPQTAPETQALHDLASQGEDFDSSGYREKRAEQRGQAPKGTSAATRTAQEPTQPALTAEPDDPADTPLERHPDGTFKKPSRGQKRFQQLNAAVEQERQARQAAEARAAEIERKLAETAAARQATPAPSPEVSQTAKPTETRPKPTEDQVGTTYASYADFVEDLADWKAEQRLAAVSGQIDQRFTDYTERQRTAAQFADFGARMKAAYPDWDQVIEASDPSIQFPDLRLLVNAPNAEHLVYTLAKDPALARKVASERDPYRLGLLIASLSSAAPSSAPASTRVPAAVSSAPTPYQPVGSGGSTTAPSLSELAASGDDYDRSGYRERRAAERGHTRNLRR